VYYELVHVTRIFFEMGDAVAALLGGTEFVLEERIVFCADNGKVV